MLDLHKAQANNHVRKAFKSAPIISVPVIFSSVGATRLHLSTALASALIYSVALSVWTKHMEIFLLLKGVEFPLEAAEARALPKHECVRVWVRACVSESVCEWERVWVRACESACLWEWERAWVRACVCQSKPCQVVEAQMRLRKI